MEHFEGKTKQNKNKKQENLTHLWDLKTKSPTLGVEKKEKTNKQTNKQTNKDKTNRRQKTRPNSMPDEIKIMMCA